MQTIKAGSVRIKWSWKIKKNNNSHVLIFPERSPKNSVSQNISTSFTADIPQGLQSSCQAWAQDEQQETIHDVRTLDQGVPNVLLEGICFCSFLNDLQNTEVKCVGL